MMLINSVLSWLIKKRIHQIELFKEYPHEVQFEWFIKLISTAKDTEWGRKYEYKSIKTIEKYQNRIPISTYEDIQPVIERLRRGENNLLWPEEIKWFAKSSGTTAGKSKFIPVSESTIEECHFKGGKDLLTIYLNNHPESGLFDGKGLLMGGSSSIQEVNNSSFYEGDLSAILMQNMPYWAQMMRTPSLAIAMMDEWESKIDMMAESTLDHNVTSISGVPSWTLVLLRKVLSLSGKNDISEVWPNLEVFFHGGVGFEPYRHEFNHMIHSNRMNYYETYNASEGFFGIQDRTGINDMLLMLDYGIFYEFIPFEEYNSESPRAMQLNEVELGENYAVVISTNSGLWRYKIGDTIRFTSLKPFRIQITGRTKNYINVVGEELIIENAEKALTIASEKTGATITDYSAAPLFTEGSIRHEWLIEFANDPSDFNFFCDTFDTALKSLNSDYEAKRYHDMVLKPPLIRKLNSGTFYRWMKKQNKLGGQHKVPRLTNNRKYIDDIFTSTLVK